MRSRDSRSKRPRRTRQVAADDSPTPGHSGTAGRVQRGTDDQWRGGGTVTLDAYQHRVRWAELVRTSGLRGAIREEMHRLVVWPSNEADGEATIGVLATLRLRPDELELVLWRIEDPERLHVYRSDPHTLIAEVQRR